MNLTDVDRKLLTWLRALGTEPDHTYQTNTRSYDHAARRAAEVLQLPPAQLSDRLKALGHEGLVEIVSRAGYSGIYYARITDDGRQELRSPVSSRDDAPFVFVSCGQTPGEEVALGAAIARVITEETPARAYFAENQATFEGVSTHILSALSHCVGFVGIMHHRGEVTNPDGTSHQRASVWIEQEIAIASYRIHTLKEQIPVLLYVQEGIKREGLRDKIMLNPVPFKTNDQVLEHFRSVVKERFGGLPAVPPSDLQTTSPIGEREQHVSFRRPSINPDFDLRLQVEPLLYRRTLPVFDGTLQQQLESVIALTECSRDGARVHERLNTTATAQGVWLHGTTPPPQMGQRPPTPYQEIEFYADGAFVMRFAQEESNTLYQAFRLLSVAYVIVQKMYPTFGLEPRIRATLDFNLHAGRNKYTPVLHGGNWTAEVDASQPFEKAFAELTVCFTRAAGLNWTISDVEDRLRTYWQQNVAASAE